MSYTAAGYNYRLFGLKEYLYNLSYMVFNTCPVWRIVGGRKTCKFTDFNFRPLDIEWYIKPNRTRPSGLCHIYCFFQIVSDFFGFIYKNTIFCNRFNNRDNVNFQKPKLPQ